MKNPLASVNYKDLLVSHGEKLALGLVGLLVLLALFLGTRWSRYDGTPAALKEKAQTAKQTIATAPWPEEQKLQFEATTRGPAAPKERVAAMFADVSLADPRFAWSKDSPITWKPLPKQPAIPEPRWLALQQPIAHPGRIVIDIPLAPPETDETASTGDGLGGGDDKATTIATFNPFAPRSGGVGVDGAAGGEGGSESGYYPGAGLTGLAEYAYESMASGEYPESYGEGTTTAPSGYPTHYVAVRMVFPAREQLKAILDARGQAAGAMSDQLVSFYDFEIERQETIAGPEKWSEWQKFDVQAMADVLRLVTATEPDVLPPSVLDPVITMPLPMPKYGYWGPNGEHSIHPLLEKLKLNTQMMAARDASAEYFYQANDYSSESSSQPSFEFGGEFQDGSDGSGIRQQKGWAVVARGVREMSYGILSDKTTASEAAKAIRDKLEKEIGAEGKQFSLTMLQQLTAMGEYMLFRFVDIDVKPGRAYRYRARLVLHNPHYNWPLDRVVHPSVAEGEFRETEWSQPTEPVVVPPDREFYVVRVDEQRNDSYAADVQLHQWSPVLGSWVGKQLRVYPGDRVGGSNTVLATVVDLVENKYKKDSAIRFETQEVLADMVVPPAVGGDDEYHSQYLPSLGTLPLQIDTPATVLDEYGQLTALDPGLRKDELQAADKRLEEQLEGYEFLNAAAAPMESVEGDPLAGDPAAGYMGGPESTGEGYGEGYGAPPQARRRQRPKKIDPLRIGAGQKRELPAAPAPAPGTETIEN